MFRKILAASTLLVTVLAAPVTALAQDTEALKRADEHFQNAGEHYFAGEYPAAILELRRGYELTGEPIFLYNISLAQLKLGQFDTALSTARQAEEEGLPEPDRTKNAARIRALELRNSATEINWDAPTPPAESPPTATIVSTEPSADSFALTPIGWTGVGLGGAGIALLAVTTAIGVGNQAPLSEYRAAADRGDEATYNELQTKLLRRQTIGQVLFFIGLPLTLGGGGLLAWDVLTTESRTLAISLASGVPTITVRF